MDTRTKVTIEKLSGRVWKMMSTAECWKRLPQMRRIHHTRRLRMAQAIDTDASWDTFTYGQCVIMSAWRDLVGIIEDDEDISGEQMELRLRRIICWKDLYCLVAIQTLAALDAYVGPIPCSLGSR